MNSGSALFACPEGRVDRRQLLAWGLALPLSAACTAERPRGEPGAVVWKPILADPPPRAPAPPPPGSGTAQIDLGEVQERARNRDAAAVDKAHWWNLGAVVRWNELARDLVAKNRTDACMSSRAYALLSVAQYDTLIAVWRAKYEHDRAPLAARAPRLQPLFPEGPHPKYPSLHGAVAAVSSAVLSYAFPAQASMLNALAAEHIDSRMLAGAATRGELEAGKGVGYAVAARVTDHAARDGATARPDVILKQGPGRWYSEQLDQPLRPDWGAVKPWLIDAVARFRAPPPPAFESAQLLAAAEEVRRLATRPTPEQQRTAALWADGDGSYTPPGRWNKIAADLAQEYRLTELRTARLFAFLNMAVMDAGIACWDSKYFHQVIRPWQIIAEIPTPVGKPPHPSYPSAHAAFSGAASAVLARQFPAKADRLIAAAAEATMSRVYGGIHYRFDGDAGLVQGRKVAQLALERAARDQAAW
jgi:membrane-associated phospholipid phosphatase